MLQSGSEQRLQDSQAIGRGTTYITNRMSVTTGKLTSHSSDFTIQLFTNQVVLDSFSANHGRRHTSQSHTSIRHQIVREGKHRGDIDNGNGLSLPEAQFQKYPPLIRGHAGKADLA